MVGRSPLGGKVGRISPGAERLTLMGGRAVQDSPCTTYSRFDGCRATSICVQVEDQQIEVTEVEQHAN